MDKQFIAKIENPFYNPSVEEILRYRGMKKDQKFSFGEGVEILTEGAKSVVGDMGKAFKAAVKLMDPRQGPSLEPIKTYVGSAIEGAARGTTDLAIMGLGIDERFGNLLQDRLVKNTHVPSLEELQQRDPSASSEELEATRQTFDDRAYINRFQFRKNLLKYREMARVGGHNLVPFIEFLGVDSDLAEGFSYFLDPSAVIPGSTQAKMGSRIASRTSRAFGKGVEKAGTLAKVPQRAINAGTEAALKAAGMADTPDLGRTVINAAAQTGLAAGVNPAFAAPAIAYGAGSVMEQAGKKIQGFARILETPSLKDGVIKRGIVQGISGGVEGAAYGATLGWAADGMGGFYAGIGTGAALGAGISAPMSVIRPNILERTAADVTSYLNTKSPDQAKLMTEFAGEQDNLARAAHMEALFPQVRTEYIHPDNWQYGDTPGFYNPDSQSIEIRADHVGDPAIISEEIFHALANSEEMGKPVSEMHHVLFGELQDNGTYSGGLYSREERAQLHEEYKSMIPEAERLKLDDMRRSDDPLKKLEYNQRLDEEIMAAHFRATMSGSKTERIAQRFSGKPAKIADYLLKNNSLRAFNQFLNANTVLGIKGADIDATPLSIKESTDADVASRDLMRQRDKLKEELTFVTDKGGLTITRNDLTGPNAETYYNLTKNTGIWERNPDGTVAMGANGKPLLKTDKTIRREEKERNLYIEGALAKVNGDGGMQPIESSDGITHYVGPGFNQEQLNAIMAIPENLLPQTLKERILKANDALDKAGDQLQIFYHARSKNHKPTWGLAPRWRSIAPYAMAISKDKNVRIQAIDMDAIDIKLDKYLNKKSRRDDLYAAYGGRNVVNINEFKRDLFQIVQDRAAGTRAVEGMKSRGHSDATAAQRVEAIDRFLNAAGADRGKGEVLFRAFRVDQVEKFVPLPDAQKFPYNHERAVNRFAPRKKKRTSDELWDTPPNQKISSEKTSINGKKLPRTHSLVNWVKGTINADLGGGKYDNFTEFLKTKGVKSYLFDPFNRTKEHNDAVVKKIRDGQADTATVNSVLNVIAEKGARDQLINRARNALKKDGTAYFLIHKESGKERGETTRGYQNQWDTKTYIPEIKKHFNDVSIKHGNLIIAKDPKPESKRLGDNQTNSSNIRMAPAAPDPSALPIEPVLNKDGSPSLDKSGNPKYKGINYDILNSPYVKDFPGGPVGFVESLLWDDLHYKIGPKQREAIQAAIDSGAANALVDGLIKEYHRMMEMEGVAAGKGWYGRMREKLKRVFSDPEDMQLFTELLGATSAKTPVENNFTYATEIFTRYKKGEFDSHIKSYNELYRLSLDGKEALRDAMARKKLKGKTVLPKRVSKGMSLAALQEHWITTYDIFPRQMSGDKFGQNSIPALRVLARKWIVGKVTPKTPQFSMNLNGASLEATIDVWAARLMRRLTHSPFAEQWRIQPKSEKAVANIDFAFSQIVFREAAKRLDMNPDDLQAIVWFGEKHIWDDMGWTGEIGAFKSSFDEAFDVYFPSGQKPRSVEHGKNIITFLQKERLIETDISTGDYKNFNNHRREYEKAKKESGVSTYIKQRGREDVLKRVPASEFPAPNGRGGKEHSGSKSGSLRSPAKRSPRLNHQEIPLNSRGGVQIILESGHRAIRVSSRKHFKVYSPLRKFLGVAKTLEDVDDLLLN